MTTQSRILRGREFYEGILEEHAASGMTLCAFAASKGLKPATLYSWNRRLRPRASGGNSEDVALLPVSMSSGDTAQPAVSVGRNRAFTLKLKSGSSLEIPPGFDPSELSRLLAVLETR